MADHEDADVDSPLPSPTSPLDAPPLATADDPSSSTPSPPPQSPPTALNLPSPPLRTTSDLTSATTLSNMTPSSTPLGSLNAARGKPPLPASSSSLAARGGQINPDIMAKMKAFSVSRQGQPPMQPHRSGSLTPGPVASPGPAVPGFPSGFKLPPQLQRPQPPNSTVSSPAVTSPGSTIPPVRGMSLAEKRGLKLPGGLPGAAPSTQPPAGGRRNKPAGMTLSAMNGGLSNSETEPNGSSAPPKEQSNMDRYAQYIDTKTGSLRFAGKAVIHGSGVDFESGRSFSISLDEVDTLDELGKGNYGTVYKVRHSRPKFRRAGQGLAGNKSRGPNADDSELPTSPTRTNTASSTTSTASGGTTGVIMAMKEMRLELDDAKFATIIMELDVLHRCISPYIVDFYGAFFQEGAVYICMEFMDGSVDRLYGDGVPEGVLRKITLNTVLGLKALKEEHNIIHRDVKPTNILVNTRGQVKICDFGVSGNLVASVAKTNIGCQSYMAPERISSGGTSQVGSMPAGSYSVQSDIWSLGLTIIECAMGRYPYPPETYDNIFSQLSAIVDGEPPDLPKDSFSEASRDFVAGCLNKIPKLRPTYPMLLQHAWLAPLAKPQTIVEEDEEEAEAAEAGGDLPTDNTDEPATPVEGALAPPPEGFIDREVGEWVIGALDRRKRGVMGDGVKPALHAAPLDATAAVTSPVADKVGVAAVAVDA